MDEDTIRRLFADAEEPIGPAPEVERFARAARRRRIGIVGVNAAAAVAVVAVGTSVLGSQSSDGPDEVQRGSDESAKVVCPPGTDKKFVTYDYMGAGWPSPRRAISATIGENVAKRLQQASGRDHVFVVHRRNGDIGAKYTVTTAAREGRWIPYTAEACADLPLLKPMKGSSLP